MSGESRRSVGIFATFGNNKYLSAPLRVGTGCPLAARVSADAFDGALTRSFTVICADLRGYGRSGCPASSPDHAPYAKRAMAKDMVSVMGKLGYPRFSVAGHDRGGRVAYRLALDHPERVERLAVLDILSTADTWERADKKLTTAFWPWPLLAQPEPLPERLVSALRMLLSITRLAVGALLQMLSARMWGRRMSKRCAIPLASTQFARSIERR
jgi:pimeloyl-ACP methyl ester carboxylesterase